MNDNIHQIELFDQYIYNELTEQKRINFENRLAQEEDFKQAFRLHKAIIEAAKERGKNLELVQRLQQEVKEERKTKKLRNRGIFAAIATAAIFILALGAWFLMPSGPTVDEFLAEHHTLLSIPETRGLNDFEEIRKAYNAMDFEQATLLYEEAAISIDTLFSFHFSIAYAYQINGNPQKAQTLLEALIKNYGEDPDKVIKAKWYKAMGLAKTKNWQGAILELKQLQDNKILSTKAITLLKAIKRERRQ